MIDTNYITNNTKNILGEFIGISELEKKFWYNFNRITNLTDNKYNGKSPIKLFEKEIRKSIIEKLQEMKIHEKLFIEGLEKNKGTEIGHLCVLYLKLRSDDLNIPNDFLRKYILESNY
ncbi:MAG: hypothetical protein V3575_05150 [Candidatus Absconditabacteria bacterium]